MLFSSLCLLDIVFVLSFNFQFELQTSFNPFSRVRCSYRRKLFVILSTICFNLFHFIHHQMPLFNEFLKFPNKRESSFWIMSLYAIKLTPHISVTTLDLFRNFNQFVLLTIFSSSLRVMVRVRTQFSCNHVGDKC